ncbi:putative hydrolase of the HAD superfamily [Methanophagales archaeon]|jgi:HAD superfamily hydrolase (TIGR01509 family)|nr:putative hydrolase of the HAD superfamily [Methanophagales archaeon]
MIKAIIFDLDGVLLDSVGRDMAISVRIFKKFGYSITKADEQYIIGWHPTDRISHFAKKFEIAEEEQRLILEEEKQLYRELWDSTSKLLPGVKETLETLKERGITLALATTSTSDSVRKFLHKFRLLGYFTLILTREDVSERKPNPEIYIKADDELGYNHDEIIVVEDTEIGVRAAKSAGLNCVAVPNQYTKKQDFSMADYVIESIAELSKFIC